VFIVARTDAHVARLKPAPRAAQFLEPAGQDQGEMDAFVAVSRNVKTGGGFKPLNRDRSEPRGILVCRHET
jgi:hypothetical protein